MADTETRPKSGNRDGVFCYLAGVLGPIIYLTTEPYKHNAFFALPLVSIDRVYDVFCCGEYHQQFHSIPDEGLQHPVVRHVVSLLRNVGRADG